MLSNKFYVLTFYGNNSFRVTLPFSFSFSCQSLDDKSIVRSYNIDKQKSKIKIDFSVSKKDAIYAEKIKELNIDF